MENPTEPVSGEVLFNALTRIFSNEKIRELGLIVSYATDGRYAPFTVTEDACLGVPFAVVPPLAGHCHQALHTLLETTRSPKDMTQEQVDLVLALTQATLLINADFYPALNLRKECMTLGHLAPTDELAFLDLVFTKHPKSGEMWAHRRWVVGTYGTPSSIPGEIRTCTAVAESYPKNYYAWSHRQWVLRNSDISVLGEDFKSIHAWNSKNVSDHSGFHHRAHLILRLSTCVGPGHSGLTTSLHSTATSRLASVEPTTVKELASSDLFIAFLLEELRYVTGLIQFYPGHETLWSHRRFVVLAIHASCLTRKNEDATPADSSTPANVADVLTTLHDGLSDAHKSLAESSEMVDGSLQAEVAFLQRCHTSKSAERYQDQMLHAGTFGAWLLSRIDPVADSLVDTLREAVDTVLAEVSPLSSNRKSALTWATTRL